MSYTWTICAPRYANFVIIFVADFSIQSTIFLQSSNAASEELVVY